MCHIVLYHISLMFGDFTISQLINERCEIKSENRIHVFNLVFSVFSPLDTQYLETSNRYR